MTENDIGTQIIDSAIQIHRELGPGLLEKVYEVILTYELRQRSVAVARQVPIAIEYQGLRFDGRFRADLIVENKVIVELKCVETLNQAHRKQLLTYLRLRERYTLHDLRATPHSFALLQLRETIYHCTN